MSEQAMVKSGGGAGIARETFGGREIERRAETATSALVAQARAEIEARYVMAMQRPRSFDDVRVRLLKECSRPGFAQRAIYQVPRGNKPGRLTGTPGRIEGLSIRFAEAVIRLAGNIFQSTVTTYDDDVKRIVRVGCVDLETNAAYSKDIVVDKTVERREPKDGSVVLGKRENSAGQSVYILQATEEELLQKEAALVSRALRTEALRLVPADILEECEQRIVLTRKDEDARDPEAARKQVVDAFATLGVMPADLELYLGHPLASASPAELGDLRGLFAAIREGELTFAEALKAVTSVRDVDAKPDDEAAKKAASQGERIVQKIRERGQKAAKGKGEAKAAATPAPVTTAAASSSTTTTAQASLPVEAPKNAGDAWEPPADGEKR